METTSMQVCKLREIAAREGKHVSEKQSSSIAQVIDRGDRLCTERQERQAPCAFQCLRVIAVDTSSMT